MVQYRSASEVPSLAVISNINTFVYRITAPQRYMYMYMTLFSSKAMLVVPFTWSVELPFQQCTCVLLAARNVVLSPPAPSLISGCHCSKPCPSLNWFTWMWARFTSSCVWNSQSLELALPSSSETRKSAAHVSLNSQVRACKSAASVGSLLTTSNCSWSNIGGGLK